MKRLIALLLFVVTASAELTRLPEQFSVTERFFSLTTTFDIETELGPFASARKRFFSLTTTFDLEDSRHIPLAIANARFFSWGTTADVNDPAGNRIGWIEEELFRILPWAEYKVFNAQRQLVAIAKMNFWGTNFEIYHPDHALEIYATISRPFFRFFRDAWTVRIKNYSIFEQGIIDPRLLIILAIYQTDKDNRDRYRQNLLDQLNQDQNYQDGRRFE